MAEYYPLIARAVGGLEKDTAENRRVLYERARTALVSQLRGNVPPLEESEITRERLALEEAIRKVEVESARRARETPSPEQMAAKRAAEMSWREEAARRTEEMRREEAARREEAIRREEESRREEDARRAAAMRREEDARREEAAKAAQLPPAAPTIVPESVPGEPAQVKPMAPRTGRLGDWTQSEPAALLDAALKNFRDLGASPARPDEGARATPPSRPVIAPIAVPSPPSQYATQPPHQTAPLQTAPPLIDALKELESYEPGLIQETWPPTSAEQVQPHQAFDPEEGSAQHPAGDFARHREELDRPPRSLRSYRRLITIGVAAVLILCCAAIIYWQRDAIGAAGRSVVTAFRGSSTPVQRESTPAVQKNTDRLGQPESPRVPNNGQAATQRAMLTTEPDANNPSGKDYVGTATWRTETIPAGPGRAAEIAIKLEVEIPDRGLAMSWLIRRNTDPTLPASHTIDIEFNMAPNSPLGAITEIRSLLMKQPGQNEGSPLWGHAQKSAANYFLVGLSATEADAQYNLRLLKGQPAFDVALVFSKVRRAFLLIEKGPVGERVFADAFAAWKQ